MNYIPIVLKENHQNIVCIGQGPMILEKIEKFKVFTNHLIFLCTNRQQINIEHCEKIAIEPYEWQSYLDDLKPRIVIQAGLDDSIKMNIYQYCLQHQIEINTVDEPSLCTFTMPVLFEKGKLNISVSTSGASPMMAKLLMKQFEQQLPEAIDEILDWFYYIRKNIKPRLQITFQEWKVLQQIICEKVMCLNRILTEEELNELLKPYKNRCD